MMFFYKCRFDFDTNRVEATLSDGSCELDFLIYNELESYVELILNGRMEEYLNTVREGQKL